MLIDGVQELIRYISVTVAISIFQFFNISSIGIIGKSQIVKSNGDVLGIVSLIIRNTLKPIILALWLFIPILWIFFPILKYMNDSEQLSPFDELFDTQVKPLPTKSSTINTNNYNFNLDKKISYFINHFKIRIKITKDFLLSTFNDRRKLISLYFIWFSIHMFLYYKASLFYYNGDNLYIMSTQDKYYKVSTNSILFFPFDRCKGYWIDGVYDKSEFMVYTITPILIYFAIKFWKSSNENSLKN